LLIIEMIGVNDCSPLRLCIPYYGNSVNSIIKFLTALFYVFLAFFCGNGKKLPRSRLRWKYTEEDMAEAILDVTDNGFSPPQAAHRLGVPRSTLVDRLNGRGAVKEQIHPHRRLSRSQEDRLALWILRQESLGYAPSHSQIRACVMGLLRQQGERPNLGRDWVTKFINRRADLKTKIGRRQEAKRFDSFTPKAVHWYFDICC
jgi:hypothetical protein